MGSIREVSEIYKRIVSLKKEGETDRQFCERVGLTTQRLSSLKHSPNPRHTSLQSIAETLGKSIPWLCGINDTEETKLESWQKWLIQQGEDPAIAAAMTWEEYQTILESELYGRKVKVPPDKVMQRVRERALGGIGKTSEEYSGRSAPNRALVGKMLLELIDGLPWSHPARRVFFFRRRSESVDDFCSAIGMDVLSVKAWCAEPEPPLDTRVARKLKILFALSDNSYEWLEIGDSEPGPDIRRNPSLRKRGKVNRSA